MEFDLFFEAAIWAGPAVWGKGARSRWGENGRGVRSCTCTGTFTFTFTFTFTGAGVGAFG